MNKFIKNLSFLFLAVFAFGCAVSSTTSTASKTYSEDLSEFRPKVDSIQMNDEEVSTFRKTDANFIGKNDITDLINKKLDTLSTNNAEIRYVNGFSIQIYSGSSSAAAYAARDSAKVVLPEIRTDVEYKQPIYKVRVGRFTERLEVQRTMLELRPIFPDAISVPTRIYIN